MKYIFSILLIGFAVRTFGQIGTFPIKKDSASKQIDAPLSKPKVKRDFKPSAIRFGIDLFGLGRTIGSKGFSQYEGQLDIDFYRYFFVIDYGMESNEFNSSEYNYNNSGTYYRVGVQANLTQYNKDRNIIFFGLRYARAAFEDKLSNFIETNRWGSAQFEVSNNQINANWFEMNLGMKGQVFKNLYVGYTVRFKFAKGTSDTPDLSPHLIPGFGKYSKGSNLGFNYYIQYRIPFRKKPIPQKIEKVRRSDA